MSCEECGVELRVGLWPWCPHEESRFRVDAFEPYFDTDLTADGVWISSAAQRRKIMDRDGLDYKERFRNDKKGPLPMIFDMGGGK